MPRYALGSSSDISDPLIYANAPYNAAIARNTPPFYVVPLTSINFRIDEVAVNHRARQFGQTKYGISRALRVVLDLMTVKFLLRYSTHPIQIFGKIGMIFGGPGVLLIAAFLLSHIGYNLGIESLAGLVEMSKRPTWVITPLMLVLFATQFISMGVLAEIQIRTYHESQNKPIYVIRDMIDTSS